MKVKDSFSAASHSLSLYSEYFQQALQNGEALLTIEEFESSTSGDPLNLPFFHPFRENKEVIDVPELYGDKKKRAHDSNQQQQQPATLPVEKDSKSENKSENVQAMSFEAFMNSIQNFGEYTGPSSGGDHLLSLNQYDQNLFGEESLRGVLSRKNSRNSLTPFHHREATTTKTSNLVTTTTTRTTTTTITKTRAQQQQEEDEADGIIGQFTELEGVTTLDHLPEEEEEEEDAGSDMEEEVEGEEGLEHDDDTESFASSSMSPPSSLTLESPSANPLKRPHLSDEEETPDLKKLKINVGINLGNPCPQNKNLASGLPAKSGSAPMTSNGERQRKKPGRKPKILDEETRIQRGLQRQEKNRLAARKCREKKQQYYTELEDEVAGLKKDKEVMAEQILALEKEVERLKALTGSN